MLEAMSSEESTYEEDGNGHRKLTQYRVRRLTWESRELKKIKKKIRQSLFKEAHKEGQRSSY